MFAWIGLGIGLLLPTIHLLLFTKDHTAGNLGRIYLSYLLPISVGFGGLMAFVGHTMRADAVAQSIGWPTGNPFQYEVAVANLAFGVLGLLCMKYRNGFWAATIVGYAVFLEGAACVHIREILRVGNWSVNNAGPILVIDVAFPLLLLLFLAISQLPRRSAS